MPERIRVKFLEESAAKFDYIKDNNISETVKEFRISLRQVGTYSYRVVVYLDLAIIIDALKSGTKSEIMEFDLEVRGPTAQKKWFFTLSTFKRLNPSQYEKLKGVK